MDTLKVDIINITDLADSNFYGLSLDTLVSVLISALVVVLVFGLGIYFSKKSELRK